MAEARTRPPLEIGDVLKHAVLCFAVFLALVPTVYMLLTSVKGLDEYTFNKLGLPQNPTLVHYGTVLFDSPFFLWMANSAILVAGAVLLSTVVSALGAFAIARMRFRGRGLLFSVTTALMAVPPVVMIVPLFVLYTQLDLISTYHGAILIYAGLITPFSVYLLTTFFRTLPKELFDSARIDGAGDLLILWKIVLPLSMAPLLRDEQSLNLQLDSAGEMPNRSATVTFFSIGSTATGC